VTHPYAPAASGAVPGTVPVGGWTPWGTWDPAAGRPVAVPAPPAAAPAPSRVLPAALLAGGVVLGLLLAAVVGALVLRGAADDVGRAAGEAMGASMGEAFSGGVTEGYYGGSGGVLGPVEQSEPVPPGELGPDPVLDAYAQGCFDGDLQSCDDLFVESPPLSQYEEYATTCGGRVEAWTAPYCTDLD
jgi:hypothetical protein